HGRLPRGNANIGGRIFVENGPYCLASVTGSAQRSGSTASVPIEIVNTGCGRFNVQFAAPVAGTYIITFFLKGAFKDTHGQLATVQRTARLTVQAAPRSDEIYAWVITLVYVL